MRYVSMKKLYIFLVMALVGIAAIIFSIIWWKQGVGLISALPLGIGFGLILAATLLSCLVYARCPYCGVKSVMHLISFDKSAIVHCPNCGNEIERA